MNKLPDLRFVIGLFFLITGALLLVYHFAISSAAETINLYCGLFMAAFGVVMIFLSRRQTVK